MSLGGIEQGGIEQGGFEQGGFNIAIATSSLGRVSQKSAWVIPELRITVTRQTVRGCCLEILVKMVICYAV